MKTIAKFLLFLGSAALGTTFTTLTCFSCNSPNSGQWSHACSHVSRSGEMHSADVSIVECPDPEGTDRNTYGACVKRRVAYTVEGENGKEHFTAYHRYCISGKQDIPYPTECIIYESSGDDMPDGAPIQGPYTSTGTDCFCSTDLCNEGSIREHNVIHSASAAKRLVYYDVLFWTFVLCLLLVL